MDELAALRAAYRVRGNILSEEVPPFLVRRAYSHRELATSFRLSPWRLKVGRRQFSQMAKMRTRDVSAKSSLRTD